MADFTTDRMTCQTTDEGLREVAVLTVRETMYDIALPPKDKTTVETASQVIRQPVPPAGVSTRLHQA